MRLRLETNQPLKRFNCATPYLLLLVGEVVTGNHHKVVPPGQTPGNRHVLLLQGKVIKNGFIRNDQTSLKWESLNVMYLSNISEQFPFPRKQGVVCEAPPPGYSHALACCVNSCELNTLENHALGSRMDKSLNTYTTTGYWY